jgi:hypothetical protein
MTRADFWCRVLGWVQIVGAVVVGAAIYTLWAILFSWIEIDDGGFFKMLMWFIVFIMAFPPFLAGLLTVIFADKVEQARNGFRENSHWLLRVILALSGLWSAGVIGFVGVTLPPITIFAVLGLASTLIAILGHEWTADLLKSSEANP